MGFMKESAVLPEQRNDLGQITDEKIQRKERVRFSVLNLFWAEEGALGSIPAIIIRNLGGNFVHIGYMNAIGSGTRLLTFLGPLGLRIFGSYRKAAIVTNIGAVIQFAVMALAIIAGGTLFSKQTALYLFLGMFIVEAIINGYGMPTGPAWVGAFIPKEKVIWFASLRSILSLSGGILFSLVFGKVTDLWPTQWGFGSIYIFFSISTIIVVLLLRGAPNPKPETKAFFSKVKGERINYKSRQFWLYFIFMAMWTVGGSVARGMDKLYLIDQYGFTNTQIGYTVSFQMLAGLIVVTILGKIGDRFGSYRLLVLASVLAVISGFGWVASAWFGLPMAIMALVTGVLIGQAHWFLINTFKMTFFPHHGRAAYIALFWLPVGIIGITISLFSGGFMEHFKSYSFQLFGATIIHYHILFFIGKIFNIIALIPLIILGTKTMDDEEAENKMKQEGSGISA